MGSRNDPASATSFLEERLTRIEPQQVSNSLTDTNATIAEQQRKGVFCAVLAEVLQAGQLMRTWWN
jgi:hypothetical protein